MTIGEIRSRSIFYLKERNIPDPHIDADYIIARRTGVRPSELLLKREFKIPFLKKIFIEKSIRERGRNKPVAYILGYKYFYLDRFVVDRRCLIPRADTEHLIYAAADIGRDFKRILDIGTGCGELAISLSRIFPEALIKAIDRDISVALINIRKLCVKNVKAVKKDFMKCGNLTGTVSFDLIVSNPPYLSDADMDKLGPDALLYEPRTAFYGGPDGLDFYRKISSYSVSSLSKGGFIILETDYKWKQVLDIFSRSGFNDFSVMKDYGGNERVIKIRKDF